MSTPDSLRVVSVVAEIARLDREAKSLIHDSADVSSAVDTLAEARKRVEAISLLAFALPVRDLAWWGVLVCWHSQGEQRSPAENAALRTLATWVLEPSPELAEKLVALSEPLDSVRDVRLFSRLIELAGEDESSIDGRRAGVAGLFAASAKRRHRERDEFYADMLAMGRSVADTPQHWAAS